MYLDELTLTNDNVLDVLYAAEKYLVGGLIDKCTQFLADNITDDSVCSIVNQSLLYSEKELLLKCIEYISQNSRGVFESSDFLNLTDVSLLQLLSCDEVGLAREMDVLKTCVKWAGNKRAAENCQQRSLRDILGDCIKQIRFGSMNAEELTSLVSEHRSILTEREQTKLLCYITCKKGKNRKAVETMGFNMRLRRDMIVYVVHRFLGHGCAGNKWVTGLHSPDTITFQVNTEVNFKGVSVFAGYEKGDQHHIKFCLKQMLSGKEECSVEQMVVSDGSPNPVNIKVDKPRLLQRYLIYKIEIHRVISGPKTFYGINGKTEVTVEGITFTFTDFCTRNNGTCIREGQIPQILFTKP